MTNKQYEVNIENEYITQLFERVQPYKIKRITCSIDFIRLKMVSIAKRTLKNFITDIQIDVDQIKQAISNSRLIKEKNDRIKNRRFFWLVRESGTTLASDYDCRTKSKHLKNVYDVLFKNSTHEIWLITINEELTEIKIEKFGKYQFLAALNREVS